MVRCLGSITQELRLGGTRHMVRNPDQRIEGYEEALSTDSSGKPGRSPAMDSSVPLASTEAV